MESSRSEAGGVWAGAAGNMVNSESGESWQELRLASLAVLERGKPPPWPPPSPSSSLD